MVHLPPPDDTPGFAPAVPKPRHDGWRPAVQAAFIAALAGGDSVAAACRRVGRSPKSAYALRRRADGVGFAAAWDAALADVAAVARSHAIEVCLSPRVVPIWYRGRQVGERVAHNERLLLRVLRRAPPPAAAPVHAPGDPAVVFAAALARLQARAAAEDATI